MITPETPHPLEIALALLNEAEAVPEDLPGKRYGKFNKQLFENSPLSNPEEKLEGTNPDALYGERNPNLAILHEQPWHRAVVYCVVQGVSRVEIARRFGKTYPWISQLVRQPWFKERVVQVLKENGGDEVHTLLQAEVLPSLEKIIQLRERSKDDAIQLRSSIDILDRFLGKATVKVETKGSVDHHVVVEEVSQLDKEMAALQAQLDGNPPPQQSN